VYDALVKCRDYFQSARRLLKTIGNQSDVEIEPESQTELINHTLKVPGVLCGGVPGAGGHDAIFVITLSDSVRPRIERAWSDWASSKEGVQICPLLLSAAAAGDGVKLDSSIRW
jgi:phosphomevalonate kinase